MRLTVRLHIAGIFALGILVNFFLAAPAWALQTHVYPEGIYVHQMAHIFYICALAYLYWDIRRTSFKGKGWFLLQLFCLVMILWNIIAFTGHGVTTVLQQSDFLSDKGYWQGRLLGPITPIKLTYYLAKMDHLVCVPALLFLFLAMRIFYRNALNPEQEKEEER